MHAHSLDGEASLGQPPGDATAAHGGAPAPDPAPTSPVAASALPPSTSGPSVATNASAGRVVAVEVPLAVRSLGNRREHWRARARRVERTHKLVRAALAGHAPPSPPVVVELERVGWNRLDVDGLVAGSKDVVDAVARWLGVDDRSPLVRWRLSQRTTRARRFAQGRWETASALRVVVRAWRPSDGDDPLRVLAAAPVEVQP